LIVEAKAPGKLHRTEIDVRRIRKVATKTEHLWQLVVVCPEDSCQSLYPPYVIGWLLGALHVYGKHDNLSGPIVELSRFMEFGEDF